MNQNHISRRRILGLAAVAIACAPAPAVAEQLTAVERLRRRLLAMRVTRFHSSWAPIAFSLTAEERARMILETLEAPSVSRLANELS